MTNVKIVSPLPDIDWCTNYTHRRSAVYLRNFCEKLAVLNIISNEIKIPRNTKRVGGEYEIWDKEFEDTLGKAETPMGVIFPKIGNSFKRPVLSAVERVQLITWFRLQTKTGYTIQDEIVPHIINKDNITKILQKSIWKDDIDAQLIKIEKNREKLEDVISVDALNYPMSKSITDHISRRSWHWIFDSHGRFIASDDWTIIGKISYNNYKIHSVQFSEYYKYLQYFYYKYPSMTFPVNRYFTLKVLDKDEADTISVASHSDVRMLNLVQKCMAKREIFFACKCNGGKYGCSCELYL